MTDLRFYAGQWVALTETGQVAGMGQEMREAELQGRQQWPKAHLSVAWVSPHPPHLPLPAWPLHTLRTLLHGAEVWLVGGAVRDMLLGLHPHDWDFAVQGDGLRTARRVADALGGRYYPLDEKRGAGRVIVTPPGGHRRVTLDFAALRGSTLRADLRLRDFTVNAIAATLDGKLFDPLGGQRDLEARLIRMAYDRAFRDDPVRPLRAVRLARQLDFRLEEKTAMAVRLHAAMIHNTAQERIQAELTRLMALASAVPGLRDLHHLGLLEYLLPEVDALTTVAQTHPHCHADAWKHTLAAVAAVEGVAAVLAGHTPPVGDTLLPLSTGTWAALGAALAPMAAPLAAYLDETVAVEITRGHLLKWGALFHDVGKRETRTVDDRGRAHFYGHDRVGAVLTRRRLRALRFSNKVVDFVATLVRAHMWLIGLRKQKLTRRAIYRFYRRTGDAGPAVVLLALADALAVWGPKLSPAYWQALLRTASALLEAYVYRREQLIAPPPLLSGRDLLAMGVPSGPQIGRLLDALREAQAAGEIATAAEARAFIRRQWEESRV